MNYVELRCKTNYSFLEGASHPEELVVRAKELGYRGLAITDRSSLAGVVRAHAAAKDHALKLIVGAELDPVAGHGGREAAVLGLAVDLEHVEAQREVPADQFRRDRGGAGEQPAAAVEPDHLAHVVLAADRLQRLVEVSQNAIIPLGLPPPALLLIHICCPTLPAKALACAAV